MASRPPMTVTPRYDRRASAARPSQPQEDVRVMLDPAGHPFCLFEDDSITTDRTGGGLREAGWGVTMGR